jgi:hypothetical protein
VLQLLHVDLAAGVLDGLFRPVQGKFELYLQLGQRADEAAVLSLATLSSAECYVGTPGMRQRGLRHNARAALVYRPDPEHGWRAAGQHVRAALRPGAKHPALRRSLSERERCSRLAQTMQVGPCIPVVIQL